MDISNISYLLFKPEAEKHFGEMREYIEKNFQKVKYFAVLDWQNIIKKLYHKHYEEKGDSFSDMLEALLASQKELYGTNAIIALVKDDTIKKEELIQKVYDTKRYLRSIYSKPRAVSIVSNANELQIPQKRKIKNRVKIIGEDGTEKKFKWMDLPGIYRIQFLNYIHSPDPCVQTNDEEIRILQQEGNLTKRFLMSREDVNFASKYKTFEIAENYRQKNDDKTNNQDDEREI